MPNLTKTSALFMLMVMVLSANAQPLPRCGSAVSDDQMNQQRVIDKLFFPRTTVYVPIVIHVVYRNDEENLSDEVIRSQIEILNKDYNAENTDLYAVPEKFENRIAETGIRFCLASIDPDGNSTSGITRQQTDIEAIGSKKNQDGNRLIKHAHLGGSDSWDVSSYLNVWVGDRDDFLGDATFPFDEDIPNFEEGIVIKYSAFGIQNNQGGSFNGGRTLTHEVAHYLNVFHLFGSETGCHNDDDLVSDTPRQSGPYFGCEDAELAFSCGSQDMASNFLNFRDDQCMNFFTKGQAMRMMDALFTYRYDLVTSGICSSDPVLPPDPLRVARIMTLDHGVVVEMTPLNGQQYRLNLYNLDGRLVWTQAQNSENSFDIQGLTMGIYVLSLEFDNQIFNRKVFIP